MRPKSRCGTSMRFFPSTATRFSNLTSSPRPFARYMQNQAAGGSLKILQCFMESTAMLGWVSHFRMSDWSGPVIKKPTSKRSL